MERICSPSGFTATDPVPLQGPVKLGDKTAREVFASSDFLAAVAASRVEIPKCTDGPINVALDIWYVRIQSLLILNQGHKAAEETNRCLSELSSDSFKHALTSDADRLSSWRLRVLVAPVKTKGVNQSAVQSYYSLAYEARAEARRCTDPEFQKQWLECIELAGLYALSTLIQLRDYGTALHLLRSQYEAATYTGVYTKEQYAGLLALLHITIGDTLGAQPWFEKVSDEKEHETLKKIIVFADEDSSDLTLDGLTAAYEGHIKQALEQLEEKAVTEKTKGDMAVPSNVANLFVFYDLLFADSKKHKMELLKRVGPIQSVDTI